MYGKFNVQIARAIDRYDIAHDFAIKHLQVLKAHDVKGISSIKPTWKYHSEVYMIVVYDNITDEMIGGMRLEISTNDNLLPFESALLSKLSTIRDFVSNFRSNGGVCEFSGLWIDPLYSKLNIPTYMTKMGIGLAYKLGIKNAFAFANNYSRPLTEKLGFTPMRIDRQKVFMYPDERYPTQLMMKECVVDENEITALVDSENVNINL
jgi:hypothetical protein